MELLKYINKQSNNKFKDFKLINVMYNTSDDSATFKFSHIGDVTEDDRAELAGYIQQFINTTNKVNVKFFKAYIDKDTVSTFVSDYINKNYSSVYSSLHKDDIQIELHGKSVEVKLFFNETYYNYLTSQNFAAKLKREYNKIYFNDINITLHIKQDEEEDLPEQIYVDDLPDEEDLSFSYKVEDITGFIGTAINNHVTPIKFIDKNLERAIIAGKIKYFNKKQFKRKNKDGQEIEKEFFTFVLQDETGSIECIYFPTKNTIEKASTLKDGMEVILMGSSEQFNNRMSFKITDINLCKLVEMPKINQYKGVNKNYICVKPQPYQVALQNSFFDIPTDVEPYLLEHDIVVFDLETTGLDPLNDEIIEIGAVKIHGGNITETFETLVKPKQIIPEEATKVNGITNFMVKDAPKIEKVIPDFYKFCNGCVLMAYNIDFDYRFLNSEGLKLLYKFDNKQIDALALARASVKTVHNYKLKTVATALGINLDNAHRAIYDTIATAEVIIKLADKLKEF